jgi:hypothetical protein
MGHRHEEGSSSGSSSFYTDGDGNATEGETLRNLKENEFLVWKCSNVTANGTAATLTRTIYGDWSKPVELVLTENPALVKNITLTDNMGISLQPNDPKGKFANYTVTLSPDGGKTWKELGQLYNSGIDFNAGYMSAQLLEDGQIEVHYNKLKVTASANADSVVNPEYCVLDCDITINRSGLKGQNISFEEMNGRTNVTITNLHDDLKGGMFYYTDNPLSGWSGNGINVENGTAETICGMQEDDTYYRLSLYGRIEADGMKLSAIYYDPGWLEIAK